MSDLWVYDRDTADDLPLYRRLRHPTASEVASVLSDADLLGELVRRGVLRKIEYNSWKDGAQILRQYVYEELVPVGESE